MSSAPAPSFGRRSPTEQEAIGVELVSALLIVIGLAAFAALFFFLVTNDEIQAASEDPPYFGLGATVERVEPQPSIDNQAHFALDVSDDSIAAQAGLQDGDILQSIGGEAVDAAELDRDGLDQLIAGAFTAARTAEDDAITLEVFRDGETQTLEIPLPEYEFLFELQIPSAQTEPIGLEIEAVAAQSLDPYFAIIPRDGSPADNAGIRDGDRLIRVDDTDITLDMEASFVDELIREEDLARADDDFEIAVEFQRLEDGELITQERTIIKQVPPDITIAFLNNFGFIIPIVTLIIGFILVRIGLNLRQLDVSSSRWAQVAFLWLLIGSIIVGFQQFWVTGRGGFVTDQPFDVGDGLLAALPFFLFIIPLGIAYWWLGAVGEEIFTGEEGLTSRNTRFAWSLLIPTLAVLILVAARPLEQTFFASLTDDVFGATRPARFVGFENYQQLLSVQLAVVDCRIDEETGECARTTTGRESIIWERSDLENDERQRAREMTSEERQEFVRYEPAFTIPMGVFGENQGFRILGKDPTFLKSFANTMQFTIASVFLELVLGMIIALVVNSKFIGRGLMRTAMLVPWAIPTVVGAVLWEVILRPNNTGIFNILMQDLGFIDAPQAWLSATGPWLTAIIAIDVWKTAPFMALLLLAGLQTIPGDVYEAADVDGASKFRQFWSITVPLLRPTIAVALVFRTLDALRAFDVFQVLLDPSRPSMALYNFDRLVNGQLTGYSSAIGVLIFGLILIFTIIYVRFVGIDTE
jgi:trehalose/maltose transport system permease protein